MHGLVWLQIPKLRKSEHLIFIHVFLNLQSDNESVGNLINTG
jgi:hypothetical protein